jgi:hypothetical protein
MLRKIFVIPIERGMIGDAPFGVSFNISNSSPNSTIATACCLHWEESRTPDS